MASPTDPFTAPEKDKIRYHLGYPSVQPAASIQFGLPVPSQTAFLVESSFQFCLPEARPRIRQIVQKMDEIECKLLRTTDVLEASKLETLETRENAPDLMEKEYCRWGYRLSNILGVPVYPFAERYRIGGSVGRAGSIPVRR